MASDLPLWLKLVLRLERAVGGPVEAAVHSDTYFDVVTELNRGTRRVTDAVESVSKRGLHLLNLPAGTDIRRCASSLLAWIGACCRSRRSSSSSNGRGTRRRSEPCRCS